MKLGIHSAPEWISTASTCGASSSTRPPHRVVDHQRHELFDRLAWGGAGGSQCAHRAIADIVIDGPDEFVTVGKTLIEVPLGESGVATDRPHRHRGTTRASQQRDTGRDQLVATQRLSVRQRNPRTSGPRR